MIEFKKETNEQIQHRKYFVEKGTPGFSPERNKYIIDQTIKKNEQLRRERNRKYREGLMERADAVGSYIRYLNRGGASPIEKWMGRKQMAKLRGKRIIQTLLKDGRILLQEADEIIY